MSDVKVWSADAESFCHQSLQDLLDSDDRIVEGSTVWCGDADRPGASELIDASDIIELLATRALDVGGEWAEDYPDVTNEAKSELEALLWGWIEKHCEPEFWSVSAVEQYTVTAADIAACNAPTANDTESIPQDTQSQNSGGERHG